MLVVFLVGDVRDLWPFLVALVKDAPYEYSCSMGVTAAAAAAMGVGV